MFCLQIAFACLLAVAAAAPKPGYLAYNAPLAYSGVPLAYSGAYSAYPYASPYAAPLAYKSYAAPLAYSGYSPLGYSAW